VKDIKAGRKEPSIISSATVEDSDELAWEELERELVADGITRRDLEKYKNDIKAYLTKLSEVDIRRLRCV